MDVEIQNNSQESDADKKSKESSGLNEHMNGVSNGYSSDKHHKSHKSDHKDKHRSKDRDKERDRGDHKKDHKSSSKDKDRHSSSSKDKDKNKEKSSSSSKDKDHSSSKEHKSSSRDKERDKDKDRSDKHKDKDKHHSSSKDHKSSSSSKDKDREHKSSSSRDKEKERDKDKERSDRDKHKHSSSSSSKDKEKDKHSSSKDKDRHSSSSKHHSSSSSKDKDRKDKEKDRERSHKSEKSSSDKHKSSDDSERKRDKYPNEVIIPAKEDYKDDIKQEIKEEQDPLASQDDGLDLGPNVSATSSCDYNLSTFKSEPELEISNDQEQDGRISEVSLKMEVETGSDDEVPLASRKKSPGNKRKFESEDDDDDVPLVARKKVKKEKKEKKAKKKAFSSENEDEEYEEKPKKKKKAVKQEIKKEVKKEIKREIKEENTSDTSPKKRKKKQEEEAEVWKWWEEEKKDDGTKWHFLEHKGPVFAPPYEPLPSSVKFFYDGKEMKLSQDAEEVAGFYARMLDHDYTTKEAFNNNFFKDWRKCMTEKEKAKITDLKKCNFKPMHAYFMDLSEKNRNRTKEEKEELKKKNAAIQEEYGFCTIDGHKEKIGNFRIEPPGLFRGRGEHPKMGMLKRRVMPEDVLINCSKDSKIPVPPDGHKWREVRHDPNVTWLASWTENVQNQVKYVMLNPSSKLKGEKDWQKYETARRLHKSIEKIRKDYREDWKSKEMRIRQRAVAMYFIDRLALRAGNEKDEDQADTVGCCSLRVEHIELHEEKDGKEYVVVFDFLGKDSIRYYNEVPVEKRVFKNLQLFMENKAPSDDLFDRLNTSVLNKHLTELMDGLTAKVFRTYNASITLQDQLDKLTNPDDSLAEKILSYNRANRAVAILCNHQRSVPKGHEKSMEKLKEKIEQKREQIADAESQVKDAQKAAKRGSVKEKVLYEKKKKMLERMNEQLRKLEVQETDRDENKTIALGTSKLNYLDPRISVAWCKKNDVPIEKIYNKTQRDKFRWAIDMAGPDYIF